VQYYPKIWLHFSALEILGTAAPMMSGVFAH